MTALHKFGAEMVKLSQGLESVTAYVPQIPIIVPAAVDLQQKPSNLRLDFVI